MGLIDFFKIRNENFKELEQMYDADLFEGTSEKIHMKKMAIQTCINMIGRTVSQSEFRVRKDKKTVKDDMYYKFNVKPNPNQTASLFWQTVVYKLIYDNECLIIKTDTDDLVIADDFQKQEYALVGDVFKNVIVKGYEFKRTFAMSEVVYFQYSNTKLSSLIDGLYSDYGALFGRIVEFQMRKNQIRSTVDVEAKTSLDEKTTARLQKFVDRIYNSISNRAVSVVPQQKGFKYTEHSKPQLNASVEEVENVSNSFLHLLAKALGIPIGLISGDLADVENQTKNYMKFCIDPLLKLIADEINGKFFTKEEFLKGKKIEIKRIKYSDLFDLAVSIDKVRASGLFTGNQMLDELGFEQSDDPMMDEYVLTKNYEVAGAIEGGEKE